MTVSPIERRGTADVTIDHLVPAPREHVDRLPGRSVAAPHLPRPAVRLCRCGHEEDAHEHFRDGNDCGACGPVRCRTFRLRTGRRARSSAGR